MKKDKDIFHGPYRLGSYRITPLQRDHAITDGLGTHRLQQKQSDTKKFLTKRRIDFNASVSLNNWSNTPFAIESVSLTNFGCIPSPLSPSSPLPPAPPGNLVFPPQLINQEGEN